MIWWVLVGISQMTKVNSTKVNTKMPVKKNYFHHGMVVFVVVLISCFVLLDSYMVAFVHNFRLSNGLAVRKLKEVKNEKRGNIEKTKTQKVMYGRLLALASDVVSKNASYHDQFSVRKEPYRQASTWKPCSNRKGREGHAINRTGYIVVSANGGLNQQRVAVCNAVAVAALLNATLVIPKFLYSSVWKDASQFGDIYQEDYFINSLKGDVSIVKELPPNLQDLDYAEIGSQITDEDIMKESKPAHFLKFVLPILLRNGVVHFLGFGNRLAFDPLPSDLQRLRCKCNFNALKFVPKIQKTGSLLVKRIRKYNARLTELDKQLLGKYLAPVTPSIINKTTVRTLKYLALHMRFETDMVAYSLCDFGGGKQEREELQAYRETHFPTLVARMHKNNSVSPKELRETGRCPLTPEEAALMLSALGFGHTTYMYLAGSQVYGGKSRMLPFKKLYPNLVTKENLLTSSELAPFNKFSSQLAALDFIACAASDVFAMTDSGSQLSSLVTGYRTYHGRARATTLRPNKRRFSKVLSENGTIAWDQFEKRVRRMVEEGLRVHARRHGKSVYREPRSPGCMCQF